MTAKKAKGITSKELKALWLKISEGDAKPPAVVLEGVTFHLVKGKWVQGQWVEEHYEEVEEGKE